ncbi:MAG: FGGY-family carbohydrate kinase [Caldilineales bacterium]
MQLLLGLDQGTSGTKAYLMDLDGQRAGLGYVPLARLHPRPDWTEQDPNTVADGAARAIDLALADAGAQPGDIIAVGIASQRDSDFVWDSRTGQPIGNAITWQDLRTAPLVEELDGWEHAGERRYRLGYFPGPWCGGLHLAWRMQHQPAFRAAVEDGSVRIGMAAGWLLTALGRPAGHLHDLSLMQKTGLWDFRNGRYWREWMERLGVAEAGLPCPAPTLYDFGVLDIRGVDVPVTAMLADQQASLFGQDCRAAGQAKCTHGTMSFVNVVVEGNPPDLDSLNVYHAWSLPDPATGTLRHTYCLEADTAASGSAVRWLANQAGMLGSETDLDAVARTAADSGGVAFVPAFTGLNVPYNDHHARAAILGMSLGSHRGHIARALLEAIGYQLRTILETIHAQTGVSVAQLNVDGGLSASDLACQIQADLLGIAVRRSQEQEATGRGAALLAGLGAGVWPDVDALPALPPAGDLFEPTWSQDQRGAGYARWQQAVRLAQSWRQ